MRDTPVHLPRAITAVRGFARGTMSKTHKGEEDFTTKKTSKVYDENHHYVHKDRRPFSDTRLNPRKHMSQHAKQSREFSHDPEHGVGGKKKHHDDKKHSKPKKGHKGAKSKTHKGDMDYTTKRGDKDHHIDDHDVKKKKKPFAKKK